MVHIGVIGGGGTVGATMAYSVFSQHPDWTLTLVDPAVDTAGGHALDIASLSGHAGHPIGQHLMPPLDREQTGGVSAAADLAAVADMASTPDLLIVTASAPRPSDTDTRGGRQAQFERNAPVMDEIGAALTDSGLAPMPVVVVTNPLDQMVARLHAATGPAWTRSRFVGYSLSETARIARAIATRRQVSPGQVSCPVMGQHGEAIVPVFSRARIDDRPADLTAAERAAIREEIRELPYEVIQLRGLDETSRWVSGYGISLLARAIATGGCSTSVCLSTPLDGAYGYSDIALSVPVTLSDAGIDRILEWDLTADESAQLADAAEAVAGWRSSS